MRKVTGYHEIDRSHLGRTHTFCMTVRVLRLARRVDLLQNYFCEKTNNNKSGNLVVSAASIIDKKGLRVINRPVPPLGAVILC